MTQCLLACRDEYGARTDEKKLGRQGETHAQNVVLEKQSVAHDGSCSHSGTGAVGSGEEKGHVSRISALLVKASSLFERETVVCDTVMVLS